MAGIHVEKMWQRVHLVEKLCRTPMRPMTVKRLLQNNSYAESALIKTAEWVRQELTIRVAYRLNDFHRLPFAVVSNPFIRQSYDIHFTTLDRLLKVPPINTVEEKKEFVETLQHERQAHDTTVDLMGQGVRQLRFACPDVSMDGFLERFFFFRIGRRIMIDHMVSLENPQPGWSGCINVQCRPADIILERIPSIRNSCRLSYGIAPRVTVGGNLNTEFAFIPDHLALIITEVLKNALRATVEFYTLGNSILDRQAKCLITDESDIPEVRIEVYKGKHDVVIKISDKGGGIPPNRLSETLSFGYSTISESQGKLADRNVNGWIRSDMAGYGFGLPLSRAFAKYFGGNIHLQPCFGVGTDVFITLNHIGDHEEPLFYEERSDPMASAGAGRSQHVGGTAGTNILGEERLQSLDRKLDLHGKDTSSLIR